MPIPESIKADREAYPLKRDQVRRMLEQWRTAPPDKKSEFAGRIVSLVKVQFKCSMNDIADDPDFLKEYTADMVSAILQDAG